MSSDWFWRKPTAEPKSRAGVLSQEQMADYFGMARNTFAAIMERQPEVLARYKKGRAKAIGTIAQGLITKARNGDITAMILSLKTQAGWAEPKPVGPPNGDDTPALNIIISAVPLIGEARVTRSDRLLPLNDEEWLAKFGVRATIAQQSEPMHEEERLRNKRTEIGSSDIVQKP